MQKVKSIYLFNIQYQRIPTSENPLILSVPLTGGDEDDELLNSNREVIHHDEFDRVEVIEPEVSMHTIVVLVVEVEICS